MVPDSSNTSHSTVGLPRLSRISRATMSTMALMDVLFQACQRARAAEPKLQTNDGSGRYTGSACSYGKTSKSLHGFCAPSCTRDVPSIDPPLDAFDADHAHDGGA